MRSYSKLGWAGLVFTVTFALLAFGAGIWMLDRHPDSLFGLVPIALGVLLLAGLPVDSVLYARGMSEEEKGNELARAASSSPAFALLATAFTVLGVAAGGEVAGATGAVVWGCWGFALIVLPLLALRLFARLTSDRTDRPSRPVVVAFIVSMAVWLVATAAFAVALPFAFF